MAKTIRKALVFVGLDVHVETISIAVAPAGRGEARFVGKIPNRSDAVRKAVKRLGRLEDLRVCYEAGACGYVLYWILTEMGVACDVVAPSLIPVKAGERVKTDRKDAEKLAKCHRAGELTSVWVPDREHEALRDLVRAREAAKKDELRARQRLAKFLLRHGVRPTEKMTPWTGKHRAWLSSLDFEQPSLKITFGDYLNEVDHAKDRIERLDHYIDAAVETAPAHLREVVHALQALRGVAQVTALTAAIEVGEFSRFERPAQLMAYAGMVSSEHSSGGSQHRGSITKTGNAHLRRVLLEAAWHYRFQPRVGLNLRARQRKQAEEVKAISWKAQHRLHGRYWHLVTRGKAAPKAATAIARELLGFMWAIGVRVEAQSAEQPLGARKANQRAAAAA